MKKYAVLVPLFCCLFHPSFFKTSTLNYSTVEVPYSLSNASITITPYADNTIWRYMEKDGKLYKRLYNTSTGLWVGDWIYVKDI